MDRNPRPVVAFVLEASHTHTGGQGDGTGSQQGLSARVVGTVCLRSEKLRRAAAAGTSESHVMIAYAHFVLGHHLISRPQEDTHMTESKTTSVWFYLD